MNTPYQPRWLYTNHNQRVVFYDLLFTSRPFGSNESETVLTDDADAQYWYKHLNNPNAFDRHDFPTLGARYYPLL